MIPENTTVWCAGRSRSFDVLQYYVGKAEPTGRTDKFFPFEGQPYLMMHLRTAIDGYASAVRGSSLEKIGTYLSCLFTFLTENNQSSVSISDISSHLVVAHATWLKNTLAKRRYRGQMHTIGNQLLTQLHARYGAEFPNLSNHGRPLKYPEIKAASSTPRSKYVPIDLEPYIKRYCLQVLRKIDQNPFCHVMPMPGTDVMNQAHVLADYELWCHRWLAGSVSGGWVKQPQRDFSFQATPRVYRASSRAKELGRATGELWCGGWVAEMRESLYPTSDEIIASVLLVTLEVGWVDAAKSFSFAGHWYTTTAKDARAPKSSEYVALTPQVRPKTGNLLHSKAVHPREGGAWWALNRIEKRTKRLRLFCKERATELSQIVGAMDPDAPGYDDQRLERDRWMALSEQSFIYVSSFGAGSAVSASVVLWSNFLQSIPQNADFEIPNDLHPLFRDLCHYDLRHVVAHRTLREAGLLSVQAQLGHRDLSTTYKYLQSHQLKHELFETYARVTGIAWNEITDGFILNQDVIKARFQKNGEQFSDAERRNLGAMTLHGARCRSADAPPKESGSESAEMCLGGSCVRCPAAVWNWHDELAIPLAAEEYTRLQTEQKLGRNLADELDIAAWEALFDAFPEGLQFKLNAEIDKLRGEGNS